MRSIVPISLGIAMIMAVSSMVSAADYNFASVQANKVITMSPGNEGTGTIYFYNIDGDCTTHITLEVSQAPDNWHVKIEPPLQETQVDIDGKEVTVLENVHVEPSEALAEEPEDSPEGTTYITIPGRGYALAKIATIIVRVPATEEAGTKSEIVISATAQWLGQSGAAAITQARDFAFSVEVIQGITTNEKLINEETIIEETDTPQTTLAETSATEQTPKEPSFLENTPEKTIHVVETQEESDTTTVDESPTVVQKWLPVIVAAVAVVFGALVVFFLVRRRYF